MTVLLILLGVALLGAIATTAVVLRRRSADRPSLERPSSPQVTEAPPADSPPTELTDAPAPPAVGAPPAPTTTTAPAVEVAEVAPQVVDEELPVAQKADVRTSLGRSRGLFAALRQRRGRKVDEETWEDLEATLLRADVGVSTTEAIMGGLKAKLAAGEIDTTDDMLSALREDLVARLSSVPGVGQDVLATSPDPEKISVWLVVGVNGVGKTTTIGKLAHREGQRHRLLLAAGDTFRAAAGEQLSQWADRSAAELVRGEAGGDPSAIVFDAVQRAKARGNDVVLADTAGRLHSKVNLIEELKKIRRVADKDPGVVTEVLLVIDATTGQNALAQAKEFTSAVEVTGIVLTKLDGSARGGVVVAIQHELALPVRFIGIGEGIEDLVAFEPVAFVDALLSE